MIHPQTDRSERQHLSRREARVTEPFQVGHRMRTAWNRLVNIFGYTDPHDVRYTRQDRPY